MYSYAWWNPQAAVLTPNTGIAFRSARSAFENAVLPVEVLWPGFAVNTLFYAAVLWMMFLAPFALRQMIRRRRGGRGQCVMCAYPIGTNQQCTECGAPHAVIPKGAAVLPAQSLPPAKAGAGIQ